MTGRKDSVHRAHHKQFDATPAIKFAAHGDFPSSFAHRLLNARGGRQPEFISSRVHPMLSPTLKSITKKRASQEKHVIPSAARDLLFTPPKRCHSRRGGTNCVPNTFQKKCTAKNSAAHFCSALLASTVSNYRPVRPCAAAAALGGGTGCFAASAAANFCASGEGFPLLTSPLAR
jgi:hypothetical protein